MLAGLQLASRQERFPEVMQPFYIGHKHFVCLLCNIISAKGDFGFMKAVTYNFIMLDSKHTMSNEK